MKRNLMKGTEGRLENKPSVIGVIKIWYQKMI